MIVTVVELLRKMYHFLAVGRIDPVVSDDQPIVSHRPRVKRLVCNRNCRRAARTKNPAICIGYPKEAVIWVSGPQLCEQRTTDLRLAKFDGFQLRNCQQKLSGTFPQFADLRRKLCRPVDDLLSDNPLTLVA